MEPEITATAIKNTPTRFSKKAITSFILHLQDEAAKKIDFAKTSFSERTRNFKSPKVNVPKIPRSVLLILGAIVIIVATVIVVKTTSAQNTQTTASNNSQPLAPAVQSSVKINKEFNFPIKDSNGNEISKIKYEITSADLQNQILVKGERATAVLGKTFLIINLKITNNYKQGIQINSRDYIRLVVNGDKNDLMAADIHNDPVEVQAISTKETRIGFAIDTNYKTLELQVGEISGTKQTIPLKFPGSK